MNLIPNSDEQGVIDAAAEFLRSSLPVARLHQADTAGLTPSARRTIAELGWFGLPLPEAQGGHGLSVVEEALVFRELGRFLGPLEVLSQCLAARVAAHAGKREWVERLVKGEIGTVLAPGAEVAEQRRVLGQASPSCVLFFHGGEAHLASVGPGDIESGDGLDKSVAMGLLRRTPSELVASMPAAPLIRDARLLCAALQVGTAEAVTTMIVEYAKIRETYGRPIGSYQAVRHPCAEMHVRAEVARSQLFMAALTIKDGRRDAYAQANAAKALANDAAVLNVHANIQLHGGIATTDEHDAHLFMKRAHVVKLCFGHALPLKELLEERVEIFS
jgi:alkylation response protein AidB-like acyl-CoA dehydrogenase